MSFSVFTLARPRESNQAELAREERRLKEVERSREGWTLVLERVRETGGLGLRGRDGESREVPRGREGGMVFARLFS